MGFDVRGIDAYLIATRASPASANLPASGLQGTHANAKQEQLLPGPKNHSPGRVTGTCANLPCPVGAAGLQVTGIGITRMHHTKIPLGLTLL